jgi:hypothetical protein
MLITRSDTSPHVRVAVSGLWDATAEMSRHTTFRFCLDPTVEQHELLTRHAGASRFAFNQCLGMVKTALTQRKSDPDINVPWTGFDLINAFNTWKKTADAGRVHRRHRWHGRDSGDRAGVAYQRVPAGIRGSRRRPG